MREPDTSTLRDTFDRAQWRTAIGLAFVVALWSIAGIVVHPIGEFPLNDDWSYAITVNRLLDTGEFRPLGWASMTLLTHVLWGALFCLPTECGFTVLRFSTLVASVIGLTGIYILILELRQPRWLAFLITLLVGFNPIYFSISHTFLTDIPFITMSIWAVVFLCRALSSESNAPLIAGSVLALVATLSRQLALCIPLAFALALTFRSGVTLRSVLRATIPLALCASGYTALSLWLIANDRLPADYFNKVGVIHSMLTNLSLALRYSLANIFGSLCYLGLFLCPLLFYCLRDWFSHRPLQHWQEQQRTLTLLTAIPLLLLAAGAAIIGAGLVSTHSHTLLLPYPLLGNILTNSGMGPIHFRDVSVLQLDHVEHLPSAFWAALTLVAVVGAMLLTVKLALHAADFIRDVRNRAHMTEPRIAGLFLMLCAFIYMLPVIALGPYLYDRYLLPAMIFLAAGIAGMSESMRESGSITRKPMRIAAGMLLALLGLYGIVGTRDYFEWNRVRWQALATLMNEDHVAVTDIDGGMEFNGLYMYDPDFFKTYDGAHSWYWVRNDEFQLAFGPVPGYETYRMYTYQNWLPWRERELLVLKKQ